MQTHRNRYSAEYKSRLALEALNLFEVQSLFRRKDFGEPGARYIVNWPDHVPLTNVSQGGPLLFGGRVRTGAVSGIR